jgi:predicted MFS family arabinose efflux permease
VNSAGFNVARALGPAIGGLIVAGVGSGVAFLLNSASFFGVIFFLYRWKRPHHEEVETGRVLDSMNDGLRYVRGAPLVKSVLIRTGAFSIAASSLLALLPVIARPYGPSGYGLLLASFGVGALAGAAMLPHMKEHWSVDGVVAFAILVFAAMTFAAGRVHTFDLLLAVLFAAGTAWIGILACLNVAAQTMSPAGLRARALSMYLLILQGGMAVGSALWGTIANHEGIPAALLGAALVLVLGLTTIRRHRLSAREVEMAGSVVRD